MIKAGPLMFKTRDISIVLTLLLLSIFAGCSTKMPHTSANRPQVVPTSYTTSSSRTDHLVEGDGKKVTLFGVSINDRFDKRKVTKAYHIDEDGDIVFDVDKRLTSGVISVRLGLEPSTKVIRKITMLTSTGSDVDCLATKSTLLDLLYARYGGELQNDATYKDRGGLFGTKTRLLSSSGSLDLGDIMIDASCVASRQERAERSAPLVHSAKVVITQKSVQEADQTLLSIMDIDERRHLPSRVPADRSIYHKAGIVSGTGFFISDDGFLLTNQHIIQDAKQINVMINGNKVKATLIDSDARDDIALLKIEHATKPLRLHPERSQAGSEITVIGYPNITVQGREKKSTFGYINALSGLRGDPSQYQISAPTQPGNSGSPLLNEQAEVIGIVVSTIDQSAMLKSTGIIPQNVNYAVKIRQAVAMLKQHQVGYKIAERSRPRTKTELIRDTSDSVVLVMSEM